MSHDPRVRLRSINRNTETAASKRVRCALAAAHESGARGEHSRLHPVSAAGTEFHDGSSGGSAGDARSFAGDQRLEVKDAEKARFNKLGFGDRGGHAKQRLAREENGSFGQSPNVASELELREIVKEF